MRLKVNVYLKDGILDPQGKAVHHALEVSKFENIKNIRIGKQIVIDLDIEDENVALNEADKMAKKLLVNQVTEDYDIEIVKEV